MDKINCNIIKDLLPSYMDEICSEDSKKLVEDHLKECNACRNLMEMITATELVSEHIGDRQIDYMKKVRRTYAKKNIISFGMMIACMLAGLIMGMNNYRFVSVNLYYCYIIVPIIMAGTYLMLSGQETTGKHAKWEPIMGGIGILLIIYCITLRFVVDCSVRKVEGGACLFDISQDKIGPFLYWQLLAVIGFQLIMLLIAVIVSLKTGRFHGILIDIHISGCCMAYAFWIILTKLTTLEQFKAIWNRTFLIVLLEGIFTAVIVLLLKWRKGGQKKLFISNR